jgi:Tfp pilus assembly protein PilV
VETAVTRGFTLIEVLAILLVLALGLGSVVALVSVGRRQAGQAQMRLSGTHTAMTVLNDRAPLGRTADAADGDGDGWMGAGSFSWTGAYTLESSGTINGFWVKRTETSAASDILTVKRRLAWVTVEVFWGTGGGYVTEVQEQILREGTP